MLRISPFARVILGLVFGIATGIFFGEAAEDLSIVGELYIKLLQMTVLPYILVSMIGGLGRLDVALARSIGLRGGGMIGLLWLATLSMVVLIPLTYPSWETAAFFSSSANTAPVVLDPLTLYVPANPFYSLANTIVPAVVVFSLLFGTALISVPDKDGLLQALANLGDALMRIASLVAKTAPIGIFAISAAAAGTLRVEELGRLQVFLWSYLAVWVVLAFLMLPMLVARGTPVSYREVIRAAREPIVTAIATGTVLVVLPMISNYCKALLSRHSLQNETTEATVDVLVPTSYSFPSAGTLLGLGFVLFAGWYVGSPIGVADYAAFAAVGALSAFGSMAVAIPFMLDFFALPADLFQLYLLGSVITGRLATGLAAMHGVVVCLLASFAMAGRLSWRKFFEAFGAVLVVGAASLWLLGFAMTRGIPYEYTADRSFVALLLHGREAKVVLLEEPPAAHDAAERALPRLEVIRARGSLRVGYLPDSLPFAYRNERGQVVGYDMDLIHALALDLGLSLEILRLESGVAPEWLEQGRLDLIVGGIVVTPDRAVNHGLTHSYFDQTVGFIVSDARRDEFFSLSAIRAQGALRIGVGGTGYYAKAVGRELPEAEIVPIDSPRAFLRGKRDDLDAIAFSAEVGSAWTLIYPEYSAVVPRGFDVKAPLGFVLPLGDLALASFLNVWLDLKEDNGLMDELYGHWILGTDDPNRRPRWSVIRDVLGWID